jgi:uncharacterized protein (UPF0332 family)
MNYLDFINTAEKLIDADNPTEADIRTAISRAYYAVFHHVLSWWRNDTRFPDYRDRGHAKIQMALYNASNSAARDFSIDLKNLNIGRRKADYELALTIELAEGQRVLNLAQNAIAAFDSLDKAALKAGIEDYLKKINEI